MRKGTYRINLLLVVLAAGLFAVSYVDKLYSAHPVLIEGQQDFDGDGRTGAMEDTDPDDRIFGTIDAALNTPGPAGLGQNGKATIVTSGRFFEGVRITGPVTLEAAGGVEADIDGFDPPAGGARDRRAFPGIVVQAGTNVVNLINLKSRNWTDGVRVISGRVNIINCVIENNLAMPAGATSWGVNVRGGSVLVSRSTITNNTTGGLIFGAGTTGAVTDSVISFHSGAGISAGPGVTARDNTFLGNRIDILQ